MQYVHININHPSDFHCFKNLRNNLLKMGKQVIVTARDKDVVFELLENEGIDFISMGKNSKFTFGKILYYFSCLFNIFKLYSVNKPDISISFAASFTAIISSFFKVPHIILDDTEHSKFNRWLYLPFVKIVLNPESYSEYIGPKQYRFDGFKEQIYLNKKYYFPDKDVLKKLKIKENQTFVLFRFVSWEAFHDVGQSGIDLESKLFLIQSLEDEGVKVFVTTEGPFPKELSTNKLKIPPSQIHDLLYFSSLFVGEGATMASESVALGIPAIYINSLNLGYLKSHESKGLLHIFNTVKKSEIMNLINNILEKNKKNVQSDDSLDRIIDSTYNLTDFLTWIIMDYPNSIDLLKNNQFDPKIHLRHK